MLLTHCLAELPPMSGKIPKAVLVRTNDFDQADNSRIIVPPTLSIFLYRVDFNKAMRAAWSAVGTRDGRAHLALDLHYLLTPWAGDAEQEHRILGMAMQCLEGTPILNGPLLHLLGEWEAGESIHIVLEEVSTEAVMRTFDSLPTDYRLSVPYIARVIRLDGRQETTAGPVINAITGVTASTQP